MHPTMMNLGEEEVNGKKAEVEMEDNCGQLESVEGNAGGDAEERSDNDEGVEEEERTKKKTKPVM